MNTPSKYLLFLLLAAITYGCSNSNKIKEEPKVELPEVPTLQVIKKVDLQRKLNETSGLISIEGSLWTHNDSGGDEAIYQFNTSTGDVEKEVSILNATNADWEEMYADSIHIYIGNFGNNLGKRKDLSIYKIEKNDALEISEVIAQEISFSYPEQTEFPGSYNHNFDAEAMLVQVDHIYIFTKNWQNQRCSLYRLTTNTQEQEAKLLSEFDTKGVITGAAIHPKSKDVILLGYNLALPQNKFSPFIWKLSKYNEGDFFSGEKTRYNLDVSRQTEAIVWQEDNTYLISAENEGLGKATLYELKIRE